MIGSDNSGHETNVIDIDPVAAAAVVAESGAILLDVREDDEWVGGHAPGAVHVRLGDLEVGTFDGDQTRGRRRAGLQRRRRHDCLAARRATCHP